MSWINRVLLRFSRKPAPGPLSSLTMEQYEAVKRAICQGCRDGLRESHHSDRGFVHSALGSKVSCDCQANSFRLARFREQSSL